MGFVFKATNHHNTNVTLTLFPSFHKSSFYKCVYDYETKHHTSNILQLKKKKKKSPTVQIVVFQMK